MFSKISAVLVVVLGVLAASAIPALAHVELEPDTAGPGTVITLTLNAAYEGGGAGMTRVELIMPEGTSIPVVDTPTVPGWTVSQTTPSGEPPRVVWEGGPALESVAFPITVGPLPAAPARLQFRVLQTYDNGEVARWIDDWPAGAAEPEHPGPILEVVAGGPGSVPAATTAPATDAPTTTTAPPATTTSSPDPANESDNDDDDSSAVPFIIGVAVGALVVGGAGYMLYRRRQAASREPRS